MNKFLLSFFLLLSGFALQVQAQVAKTQVVRAGARANTDGTITLYWPQENYTGTWQIYRRNTQQSDDWGNVVATVPGNQASWTDISVNPGGEAPEYLIAKINTANQSEALGYVYAGNNIPEVLHMGGLILLVDSSYLTALRSEIDRLVNQLRSEGWMVSRLAAGRKESPAAVKARIKAEYNRRGGNVSTLYVLGHVPVPYSGDYSGQNIPPPDGHSEGAGNHTGAWPADCYYGDLDGEWFDSEVTRTTGSGARLHNIPGDGKFDQTKIPGDVELEIGRVDLFDMPAFSRNDTLLVKKYLNRSHLWRTGKLSTVERALIDNNFGSLNLASTGYHNFATMFPPDSIWDNRDYFTEQKAKPYLWSYGCGAGSYTSCSGVGNTNNFAADSLQNIFTILAGSYFGDWDVSNNLLRAPLANSALACFWGGIPKWYVHHMALGKHIGYGARLSMNNNTFYFNGQFNFSHKGIHIALMGDPTLRQRHVAPPSNLIAASTNNRVLLTWTAADGDIDGYAVYRYDSARNSYFRVNKGYLIQGTSFYDSSNYLQGRNLYTVRALRLETTNSGTWWNASGGPIAAVNHTNSLTPAFAPANFSVFPNPTLGQLQLQLDEAVQQAHVRIFDMNGRQVLERTFSASTSTMELQLGHLTDGVYTVQLEGRGKAPAARRFVKAGN
jgi:hypothetical protein